MHLLLLSTITLFIHSVISAEITCKPGIDCILDENNITLNEKNNINAQNATSLTLKCYHQNCKRSVIKCPNGPCNIFCYDEKSCEDAQITTYPNTKLTMHSLAKQSAHSVFITGDNTDEINLSCQADESCDNVAIYDSNAKNINIFCATTPSSHESCSYLKIHAENADNVNINCGNGPPDKLLDGSCEKAELYLDNANKINIIAYNIQYGKIKAHNAKSMNLTCIAKYRIHDGCYKTEVWFPNSTESGVNSFNCYGSCELLGIHDIKCDVFNAMNVNLNGCGLKHYIHDFIDQWSFWYNHHQNAINSFQEDFHCFPWQVDEFINACNCSDVVDMISNVFVDDATMHECAVLYDRISTTALPVFNTSMATTDYYTTTSSPTQKPSMNPSKYPSQYPSVSPTMNGAVGGKDGKEKLKGAKLALIIIVPLAVILIVVGFVIFFVKQNSSSKGKHEKVMVSDNDEEADDDMEHVPIVTQVQMESPFSTH